MEEQKELTIGEQFRKNLEISVFKQITELESHKPEIEKWARDVNFIDSLDDAAAAGVLKAFEAMIASMKAFADKISTHVEMGQE